MKHPRVCRECEFWVVIEEDDGYCHRPVPRAATGELASGEGKDLLENGDCKQD